MSKKGLLRKHIYSLLRILTDKEIQTQSENITRTLKDIIKPHQSIACFMSMENGEVDTHYILKHIFEQNKTLYLPRCTSTAETGHERLRDNGDKHHGHLTFHRMNSWDDVEKLEPQGKFNLREPKWEEPAPLPPSLDVILVPGVAFELQHGGRIGHGAGFYDDFFQRYHIEHHSSPKNKPLLVGLSLNEQIVKEIPLESHDYGMDAIVCGDGKVYWFGK